MAPGYIYDDARSVDSRSELSSEDSFVVRDTPDKVRILNRNRRLGVADRFAGGIDRLPDDSGTEFGSNSDGGEGLQGLNRILDSEEEISDEESSAIATQEVETREDLDSDSDSSSSPPPEVTKRRKMVIIESDSE